jgi:hypothetical protein
MRISISMNADMQFRPGLSTGAADSGRVIMEKWGWPLLVALIVAAVAVPSGASAQRAGPPDWRGNTPRDIEIRNAGEEAIDDIRISRDIDSFWGANRLDDDTVMPGSNARIPMRDLSGECLLDVRVKNSGGTLTELFGVDVCRNPVIEAE